MALSVEVPAVTPELETAVEDAPEPSVCIVGATYAVPSLFAIFFFVLSAIERFVLIAIAYFCSLVSSVFLFSSLQNHSHLLSKPILSRSSAVGAFSNVAMLEI